MERSAHDRSLVCVFAWKMSFTSVYATSGKKKNHPSVTEATMKDFVQ